MREQPGLQDLITGFRTNRSVPDGAVLRQLLREYARPDCQLENTFVELKGQFAGDNEAWLNLKRQIIGFSNSGGGILIFGISEDHDRVGLTSSLLADFDPANLIQKIQQHAAQAVVPTAYVELVDHKKLYGFLLIGQSSRIWVFDKVGNAVSPGGKTKTVFQPGVVYVRTEGTTREARQVDLDQIVNERMSAGLKAFLARIERVAELPPSSELLARTPGSDQAYVLVSGGQGIPVSISSENTQGVVQLSEVLTPDARFPIWTPT